MFAWLKKLFSSREPQHGLTGGKSTRVIPLVVTSADEIRFEGEPLTLASLRATLQQYVGKDVVVYYQREHPEAPASGFALQVAKSISDVGLAIAFPPDARMPTVKIYDGSPPPADVFQPHMPSVHLLADMDSFFAKVRSNLAAAFPQETGKCGFAIITPTRDVIGIPWPAPDKMPPDVILSARQLLPPSTRATISVISHTVRSQTIEDLSRCIPFLGYLGAFASIGHSVVVFEGHPSAFESGVRNTDVLLVDSGMLPFIQKDWLEVARKTMLPNSKILLHDRETYTLLLKSD
jgi:hypothetical protein